MNVINILKSTHKIKNFLKAEVAFYHQRYPYVCPRARGPSLVPGCQPHGPNGVGKMAPRLQDVGSPWQPLGEGHTQPFLSNPGQLPALMTQEWQRKHRI